MLLLLLQFNFSLFPPHRIQIAGPGTPFIASVVPVLWVPAAQYADECPGDAKHGAGMHSLLP